MLEQLRRTIRRVLALEEGSGQAAAQRLQVVLVQDRTTFNNETLEALKNDLVAAISKYAIIDREAIEVEVRRSGTSVTLVTNIPIHGTQRGPVEGTRSAG